MKFETTRDGALKKLDNFIENEIINYNSKRNFDFGPKERKNVSCLSPYITHRLITEYETVERVLKKRPYQKVEKYIQEIFLAGILERMVGIKAKSLDRFY